MQQVILKFLLSNALLLFVLAVQAQDDKSAYDSLRKIRKPTGLRLGTDLIAIGKTMFDSPLTGWELNADVDFGRYYFAVDYGSWSRKDSLDNGYYENDGRYWRVGADVNFLLKDPDRNMVFIGFRYGRSSFNEQLTYLTDLDDFGAIETSLSNQDATAGWLEMTGGLRVKIWKALWMGYTARLKFASSVKGDSELETYDIPGYGKTSKSIYWGFNYQVFYRIPFQKEK
jgi:hypothetical protein